MSTTDDSVNKQHGAGAPGSNAAAPAALQGTSPVGNPTPDSALPPEVHGIEFVLSLLDFPEIKAQLAALPFPKAERSINFFVFMLQANPDCASLNYKAIATILYAADNDLLNRNDFAKLVRRVVGTGDNLLEGVQQLIDAPHILGSRRKKSFSLYEKGLLPKDVEPAGAPADPVDPQVDNAGTVEGLVSRRVEAWTIEHVNSQLKNREAREATLIKSYLHANRKQVHIPDSVQISALLELKESMPNFAAVVDFIHKQMTAGSLTPDGYFTLPPLLLGGEPGIGKTLFSQSVCKILGFPETLVIPCGLENASFALGGSSSTWSGAKPGIPATMMRDATHANVMIVLDEIDKFRQSTGNGGDPFAALYQLLEPANAKRFVDQYLLFPIDMSRVNWVLTANDISILPGPIMNRVKYIPVPPPDRKQMAEKVIPSVYKAVLQERCLAAVFDTDLPAETVNVLLECKTPRDVRFILIDAIGDAALRITQGGQKTVLPCDIVTAQRVEARQRIGF